MGRWKKGVKEFVVNVNHHETRGDQIYLPKPIMDDLDRPDSLRFKMVRGKIVVESGDDNG